MSEEEKKECERAELGAEICNSVWVLSFLTDICLRKRSRRRRGKRKRTGQRTEWNRGRGGGGRGESGGGGGRGGGDVYVLVLVAISTVRWIINPLNERVHTLLVLCFYGIQV